MGLLRSAVLIATLVRSAAGCDTVLMNQCVADATTAMAVADTNNNDKTIMCNAMELLERCIRDNSADCTAQLKINYNQQIQAKRTDIYGRFGASCLNGAAQKEIIPLSSGDSGSASGSAHRNSSGSAYGYLLWQALLLTFCICLCICGIGGAASYFLWSKKKSPKPKREKYPDYQPEYRPEEVPLATIAIDANDDGRVDAVVTGVDMNRDGIPDALQGDPTAAMKVEVINPAALEPVPPMVEVVEPIGLFGPMPGLLPTASAYPAYNMPATTAYAQPMSYAQPMASYAQPMTSYAQPTTSYAQPTTSYAQPRQYAPTNYAGGVI